MVGASHMKWTSFSKKVSTVLLGLTMASRIWAEDVPTFSEPEVNTFVKSYAQFADDYVVASNAMKAGDSSKLQALQAKATELQKQTVGITDKLKPEETSKFAAFITICGEKVMAATKER